MPVSTSARSAPLTDAVVAAVGRLVDDAKADRRDPSQADLTFLFQQAGLAGADLTTPAGKKRRVRQVLSWALEHDEERGAELVARLIATVRACGGFRPASPNFVGEDPIKNAQAAFAAEGFQLADDGELRPTLLQGVEDSAMPAVLRSYVRRAQRGSLDAALVVGTGKDLLEATAAYVLLVTYSTYNETANFPTLLGQAFTAVGLATSSTRPAPGEPAFRGVERGSFDLGCAVNRLRNKDGAGHGRPFPTTVSEGEARYAVTAMGAIAQLLLDRLPR